MSSGDNTELQVATLALLALVLLTLLAVWDAQAALEVYLVFHW